MYNGEEDEEYEGEVEVEEDEEEEECEEIMQEDVWVVISVFFEEKGFVWQQLDLFDEFILNIMQEIVDELVDIEIRVELQYNFGKNVDVEVEMLYKINFG